MKKFNSFPGTLLLTSLLTSSVFGQAVMLDPNFNTNGYSISDFSGNGVYDAAVGVTARTVYGATTYFACGYTDIPGSTASRFTLALYGADGHLQSSSLHQVASTDISVARACARVNAANFLSSNYYLAGRVEFTDYMVWHLAKFNHNLSLMPSFANNGYVETYWGPTDNDVSSMAIQPDGKVVLAGYVDDNIALLRYTTDGTLDNSFSSDGKVISNVPGGIEDRANAIQVGQDGAIYVAGTFKLVPIARSTCGASVAGVPCGC